MSAELLSVIAAIIRRHTRNSHAIPLLSRYDPHERQASPAMPFLFQRKIGTNLEVISPATVVNMLRRRCEELAERHPDFRTACFTPHDFRRLFATDLMNNGLPIHIGAALLGHLNLQTTRGYANSQELHQPGEKPQVSRSQDRRNSILLILMPVP